MVFSIFSHDLAPGDQFAEILNAQRPRMRRLLRESIARPSFSGGEAAFVRFIEGWANEHGLETESATADEASLAGYPQANRPHLPLAGRPVLLIRLPGDRGGCRLLFNAHSDVVPAGDPRAWHYPPWEGAEAGGRIYGRGAVDDKGPLAAALWAMLALRDWLPQRERGEVLLELIPGEEDCVGLGTLASLARGVTADGVIVLEPTECLPRCASRAGCRFAIEAEGRAIHGTLKWLGADAIEIMRRVLEALERLETRWNDRDADPLFAAYPIARPITVDKIAGGEGLGMIAERCRCAGYLELLPDDSMSEWEARFRDALMDEMQPLLAQTRGKITITFGETYDGHRTPPEVPFCRLAADIAAEKEGEREEMHGENRKRIELTGFNSGCEAGLRARLEGLPTLVWGPGSLAEAHAADESIALDEVERCAAMFAEFAARWVAEGGVVKDA